jgi:hypothetical protein
MVDMERIDENSCHSSGELGSAQNKQKLFLHLIDLTRDLMSKTPQIMHDLMSKTPQVMQDWMSKTPQVMRDLSRQLLKLLRTSCISFSLICAPSGLLALIGSS